LSLEEFRALEVEMKTIRLDETILVKVSGEVDMHGAGRLQAELDELNRAGARHVIVDLSAVPFLDSAALGVLALEGKRTRADGASFRLVAGNPRVRRVFEVTGLDRVLTIERSVAAAIAAATKIAA
jgi:anti-anti-sigma factor